MPNHDAVKRNIAEDRLSKYGKRIAPIPKVPANIKIQSDPVQNRMESHTYFPVNPCLRTNAFWEPIATIRDKPIASPEKKAFNIILN